MIIAVDYESKIFHVTSGYLVYSIIVMCCNWKMIGKDEKSGEVNKNRSIASGTAAYIYIFYFENIIN